MPRIRRGELRRHRVRRKKLAVWRYRYEHAEDEAEKARVLKKLFNVAPWLALEFQEKAQPAAAPPPEEIARRKKKARRARGEAEGAGPRAGTDEST